MKEFLNTLAIDLSLCCITVLGFYHPQLWVCKVLFGIYLLMVILLIFMMSFCTETIIEQLKKGRTLKKVQKQSGHRWYHPITLLNLVNSACLFTILWMGGYQNTAVFYAFLAITIRVVYRIYSKKLNKVIEEAEGTC